LAKFNSFEEILSWQKARELNLKIYKLTNTNSFYHDNVLKNQIRRASVSITSNIAEGFERNGNREFIQFLSIAKASCGETRSQLYRAFDRGYLNDDDFEDFKTKVISLSRQINGFIDYLQKSDFKGTKFK